MTIKEKIKELVYTLCLGDYGSFDETKWAQICSLLDKLTEDTQ